MKTFRIAVIALTANVSCTHAVHLNHTSDFTLTKPLAEHRRIESQTEQQVILWIVGNTDYADQAYGKLMSQCVGGTVTGIQTRYSTSHNFLSWKNIVRMWGYCSE